MVVQHFYIKIKISIKQDLQIGLQRGHILIKEFFKTQTKYIITGGMDI